MSPGATRALGWLLLAAVLVGFGVWIRGSIQARSDLKDARQETETVSDQAADYDRAVADKIQVEAAADAAVRRILNERDKAKAHDQAYRDYLDSPIPESSRRLYERAAQVQYGPAEGAHRADPGADDGD